MAKKIGFYLEDSQSYEHKKNNEELFYKMEDMPEEEKPLIVSEIVENNLRLIHHLIYKRYPNLYVICQRIRVTPDDVFSVGYYGLMKAIHTFNVHKKILFATYASRCINNEFGMFMRQHRRSFTDTSIHEVVYDDGSSVNGEVTLLDLLVDDKDLIAEIVSNDFGFIVMEEMERVLKPRELAILRAYIAEDGMNQREIATALGISQSYISRILKRTINKAKKIYRRFEVV